MVLTASNMLPLGTIAPNFGLADVVSNKIISLTDFRGYKGLVIMFISHHCPFVKHIKKELANIGNDYKNKNLGVIAISSNDVINYPDDSPKNLKLMAEQEEFNFPICYDETQEIAKNYLAACTPDFYLFDSNFRLVYRGQLDDSRPSLDIPVTGKDLRNAIDALLTNQPINIEQKPSIGCNIKWKNN
ncbi:PPO candidate 1 [Geminocystis sp. NIES-3708]|uniref:thioredoxin family protein n=1 Tax=Geminocystis sp. NIES-3708 TaxID=1615909 RepID=UPI0005FC5BB9|nr:thioredoxin family protein [Geminocystis sp. NIES-3708]BAQ61560.1 PPO candidate 1 [Geminocystis sp. NIES-3708]